MTYEVQLQLGSVQYTVRGPETDGVLSLIERLQTIGRQDPAPGVEAARQALADEFVAGLQISEPLPKIDEPAWIPYSDGGPMPLSACVEVRFAHGSEVGPVLSCDIDWSRVVAYRVLPATPLPKIEDPHADLRATWAPGQHWQTRNRSNPEWISIAGTPFWHADQEYRRVPEDGWIEWAGTTSPVRAHAKVRVKLASGYESGIVPAHTVEWNSKSGSHFAIVAYRVVKPETPLTNVDEWQQWTGGKMPVASGTSNFFSSWSRAESSFLPVVATTGEKMPSELVPTAMAELVGVAPSVRVSAVGTVRTW